MKKIIVPVDFSNHSEYALRASAILAKKHNAEIVALHMLETGVIPMSGGGMAMPDSSIQFQEMTTIYLEQAERNFNTFLKKKYLEGIKVTPIIKHFKVFNEVNEVAKEYNADIIIMGSHGSSGFKEFFVGSNTEKVVRSSDIPVLVLKNQYKNLNFDDVVFALDFSEESVDSYKKAMKVLTILGKNIHLVHINTPHSDFMSSYEIEKKIVNFLEKAEGNLSKLNTINYVADYSIEKGILNFSNVVGGDLISVITHGRKGLAHYFSGSVSEDLTNHATLPIITFKI